MPSLDKKYRPSSMVSFFGNEVLIRRIKTLFKDIDSFPSSILLHGPSGCGKTTLARIIAKMLKVSEILELNISDTRRIDDARNIIYSLRYASLMESEGKVVILNECHKATNEFQNAILEKLEEPPKNVYFILCTTEPNKLLNTIKTRCSSFQVERLPMMHMKKLVLKVARREKIEISRTILRNICSAANGTPRQALLILNSIKNLDNEEDMIEFIKSSGDMPEISEETLKLCQALMKREPYKRTMKILSKIDEDPEIVRRGIIVYMTTVLLNNEDANAALVINNFWDDLSTVGKGGLVLGVYNTLARKE
jgi:DNA polymerase-3 subunit gamma/tau